MELVRGRVACSCRLWVTAQLVSSEFACGGGVPGTLRTAVALL